MLACPFAHFNLYKNIIFHYTAFTPSWEEEEGHYITSPWESSYYLKMDIITDNAWSFSIRSALWILSEDHSFECRFSLLLALKTERQNHVWLYLFCIHFVVLFHVRHSEKHLSSIIFYMWLKEQSALELARKSWQAVADFF